MLAASWSRGDFLRTLGVLGAAAALPSGGALAAFGPRTGAGRRQVLRIGFLLPEGPVADGAARGAELGGAEAGQMARLFERQVDVIVRRGPPDSLSREARRLLDDGDLLAIAGGLDESTCESLGGIAEESGSLYLNVGCSSDRLRGEACRRHTFHIEASSAMYADALAEWAIGSEGHERWHFVAPSSDDAVYRRARQALLDRGGEEAGLTSVGPGALDASAVLDEVRSADTDLVFVALDDRPRADLLEAYSAWDEAPPLAGPGLSTRQLGSTTPGNGAGVWPTLWHDKLFRYGAEQLNDRYRDRFGEPLEARGWASWMAVKIVTEAALRSQSADPTNLADHLESDAAQFDGHKGIRLSFRPWDHQLRQPIYLVRAPSDQDSFEHLAELPTESTGPDRSAADVLDELGDPRSESECELSR